MWCGCVLLLPALALANFTHGPSVPLDLEWESWKTVYKKVYNSQEEERIRRSLWENNMQLIDAHNQEYKLGIHSYELGMNSLGDMGSCGSCWAFSAVGALEGLMKKKTGKLVPLSPQNLVDCVTESHGCKGGFMNSAFKYVHKRGIDSEEAYPYAGKDGRCAFSASGKALSCRGYRNVASGSERALQAAVATVGPVSAAVIASLHTFYFYKNGVYDDPKCSGDNIDHAVLVVGYSSTCQGKKYWIIKNSWGAGWGMKGYMRLARDSSNACSIATMASYPF